MNVKLGAVFQAAVNGDAEEIKAIIRRTVDEKEPTGRTPLMQAATYGHDRVLEQLLVFGAVPDTGDSDKNTALHEACLIGNYDTVSILLEYNAQINIRNKDGDSPLHLAAFSCNMDVVELLLNSGAQVNMKNKQGQTPKEKLRASEKSTNYREKDAEEIIDLLHEWRSGKPIKSKASLKSKKEENIECLKEIKENVSIMTANVTTLVEKIDYLSDQLQTANQKLEISEERANRYEQQVIDLKAGVIEMQNDLQKNGEMADKKLTKLITITESIFDNLCSDTNFNDRVYYSIFNKIATTVGAKQECWKDLTKKLFEGHNKTYVNDQINDILSTYHTDTERAHESLLRWKVIMATQVHKLGPLQKVIRNLGIPESEMLCNEIDNIMDKHTSMVHQEPTGSLSEKGLYEIAKQLGREWRDIGIQLDFTTANLDNLKDSYPDSNDRNHHMLVSWVQREPGFNSIKLGRLAEALKAAKRLDISESLTL